MKKQLFILSLLFLISCNQEKNKKESPTENRTNSDKNFTESPKNKKGSIKDTNYHCNVFDFDITISSENYLFYPISTNRKNGIKIDLQKIFMTENDAYKLICFGNNSKNYFSAYMQPTQNKLTTLKQYSNFICSDLKSKYSPKNKEIAFKQNLNSNTVNATSVHSFSVQLMTYPNDELIVKRQVYVKREKGKDIVFSITYTDEDFKNTITGKLDRYLAL